MAKARAEEAKNRAFYAEKEAALLKENALLEMQETVEVARLVKHKADLKADLDLLSMKKEAAATEAVVGVLESEFEEDLSQVIYEPPLDAKIKTAVYVDRLAPVTFVNDPKTSKDSTPPVLDKTSSKRDKPTISFHLPRTRFDSEPATSTFSSHLNPNSAPFVPNSVNDNQKEHEYPDTNNNHKIQSIASDFTSFLLKRDLLHLRFNTFDDRPEFYPSWKSSFKKIVNEIRVDASEEIDLLVKWTGSESRSHVQSIKAANTYDPEKAVRLIWARLDERYGSPEHIDQAIRKKLDNFPRITNDYSKLYVLSDILAEIVSIKENESYGCLFSYFDCSVGVKPIVGKLPIHLQERWTRTAVDYNERNGTIYPPFRIFADFVHKQSTIKNNPCFSSETTQRNAVATRSKPFNANSS